MIRRALTNTGWLMGARAINAVLSLVYLAIATRELGPERFGIFVIAFTFAQLVVGFCSFQTWQSIIRWGQDDDGRKTATGFALALDSLTIVVGAILGALILFNFHEVLLLPDKMVVPTYLFTLASLLAIRSTPIGLLRLHDRYDRAAIADATTSIVRALGAGVVVVTHPSIQSFLIVWGAAEVLTAAIYWWLAARTEPIHWQRYSLRRLPREAKARGEKVWSFAIGTSLTGILSIASRQLLVVLTGVFGGAALAGVYRVANQLGDGLLKLAQALLKAVYPELVRNPDAAKALTTKLTRIAIFTGVIVVAFGLLAGEWIITAIAGREYLAAFVPMIVLAGAASIELAGASLEALLVARGHAIRNFLLRGIPLAIGLIMLPWLIDWFGATGAALVVLGTSLASVTGFILATRDQKVVEKGR
ncbi:lipopolysaccharide biosynthesis protein [Aurantiacibacter sediminis]|uniref:Oligosaccharide flippase family protein n=1 Tax=Aurantiacibacter sediminis TaxID=2793064 RepID=A0ABS0N2G4_9SPHN|nr:oligosaccharide flippase family protein [Aurantiacibacter sediminis]MBH5322155.1 oligosaccharide flippase family protein [Aurantiacibacter sediminis]